MWTEAREQEASVGNTHHSPTGPMKTSQEVPAVGPKASTPILQDTSAVQEPPL